MTPSASTPGATAADFRAPARTRFIFAVHAASPAKDDPHRESFTSAGLVNRIGLQCRFLDPFGRDRRFGAMSAAWIPLVLMQLSAAEDYWRQIGLHTHNRLSMGSPWSVQLQAAALVGNHSITASWAAYIASRPSLWTIVAVTDDERLIHLRGEFDAEQYDHDAEQRTHRMGVHGG
jgi:hypothetical protein